LFLKIILFFLLVFSYSLNLYADEKQSIINQLLNVDNLTFNFEQVTEGKMETGTCLLVFNNKLKCNYIDDKQKEIIINNKTLVVMQKRYGKIYFYPISKSPFVKILDKNSLISLIRESNLEINDSIDLIYVDKNEKKITVFFGKKNYDLVGWKIQDTFQNEIYFSLKIQSVNTEINDNIFKIPSLN
jgi:outer membrane lipoprotein-sorting protein